MLLAARVPREMRILLNQQIPQHPELAYFCICHRCAPMMRQKMEICCGQTPCITETHTFSDLCLKHTVVEIAGILNYAEHFFDLPDLSPSKFRNQSYRFFILWQYGKLGQHNRKCPPSCVVLAIRKQFPSDDGTYLGYRSFDEDE